MGMQSKSIYGYPQYPHMVFCWAHDPNMDIKRTIADNVAAWMAESPTLDTLKKLATRSGVSFGTIQRVRNAEVNLTVENLVAIASAFGRTAAELVTPPDAAGTAYVIPSSNRQASVVAAESTTQAYMRWPFPHANQQDYESLPSEGKVWVQGMLSAAIEQARQQFGTVTAKRSA